MRVLHLSDLHLTPTQHRKIEWVRSLAHLEPDFVLDTGDNFAHVNALPALTRALAPLLEFPGAFVMGSNDYYAPRFKNPARYLLPDARIPFTSSTPNLPAAELGRHLSRAGWLDLSNTRDRAVIGNTTFDFVGVDDPHIDRDVYPEAQTMPESSPEAPAVRVGVVHAPYTRVLNAMHDDQCSMIIAGHTHGGQLCVPGFGALVTNCDIDRGRARGLHGWPYARPDMRGGEESCWLHVSGGLGTSPYAPVRFACRPEATLLTLIPA
ncbi:metallophosphoesterase [Timonella sp. A28]|uniref:metallophosphoesterase n=1 Tax=Timonella sp. A28 TaxID=3442640 RepID=UPI003EBFB02D